MGMNTETDLGAPEQLHLTDVVALFDSIPVWKTMDPHLKANVMAGVTQYMAEHPDVTTQRLEEIGNAFETAAPYRPEKGFTNHQVTQIINGKMDTVITELRTHETPGKEQTIERRLQRRTEFPSIEQIVQDAVGETENRLGIGQKPPFQERWKTNITKRAQEGRTLRTAEVKERNAARTVGNQQLETRLKTRHAIAEQQREMRAPNWTRQTPNLKKA